MESGSPNTSMPVQKEPYLYMTQSSSSDGLSLASLLATTKAEARPVSIKAFFASCEKKKENKSLHFIRSNN